MYVSESLHALEILPVPYPVVPWVAPKPEHTPTNFRIDDSEINILTPPPLFHQPHPLPFPPGMSLRPLPDELVVGQMRDWNEEIQSAREFPKDTSAAKVFRDRALFKVCDVPHPLESCDMPHPMTYLILVM